MAKFDPASRLTKLKGKDYLEVKWRLVWFRDVWPHGTIMTEPLELTDQRAVFRATVTAVDAEGNLRGSATGTKSETPRGFADYIEKAETGSIGRALAALGFGTQFEPELEEGERIVDSPVEPQRAPQRATRPQDAPQPRDPVRDRPNAIAADGTVTGHSGMRMPASAMSIDDHDVLANTQLAAGAPGGAGPSPRQVKLVFALARDAGLDNGALHQIIYEDFGHESINDMDRGEMSSLIDSLKDRAGNASRTRQDAAGAKKGPNPVVEVLSPGGPSTAPRDRTLTPARAAALDRFRAALTLASIDSEGERWWVHERTNAMIEAEDVVASSLNAWAEEIEQDPQRATAWFDRKRATQGGLMPTDEELGR